MSATDRYRRLARAATIFLLASVFAAGGYGIYTRLHHKSGVTASGQTDVDRAEHRFNPQGVPYLKIATVGEQYHPAGVAVYALAYAGIEVYDANLVGLNDDRRFDACVAWLEQNLKQQPNGLWVWEYHFDNTYNDITIKAPWSSAFAQATGVQAFLVANRRTANPKYLDLARKAARPLFTPIEQGGFLFQSGEDVWFEEIPQPAENPSHILNGHMRVLLALKQLADATDDTGIADWFKRGTDSLYRWLPRYDTGYWLRYDLNPRKSELLFRLANPYGYTNHPLAVDKITLRDPVSKEERVLDVGAATDAESGNRIAGIHWGQIEEIAGRSARRLIPAALENKPDELAAPHSYFYLSLPGDSQNNLRDQWYDLIVDYFDDAQANITVQMRSIAPGQTFRDLRDGDLLLTGSRQWRRWIVPVRPSDLGYWVGASYAEKHQRYLAEIARWDKRFVSWSNVARGYANLAMPARTSWAEVTPRLDKDLPRQSPMLPYFSLSPQGVVLQHIADSRTILNPDGTFDPAGGNGVPVYAPYVIAEQLLLGAKMKAPPISNGTKKHVSREPALRWILNRANYTSIQNAAIYKYPFENTYNDVFTPANWASAFGQAYILKSLIYADEQQKSNNLRPAIQAAVNAYSLPVETGGISSTWRYGLPFFEEVPNATHVLNAHIASINALTEASQYLHDVVSEELASKSTENLRNTLYLFDTGYWLRYDQNPRKEVLLQIDWLEGDVSPLIDDIRLFNPVTETYTTLDIGKPPDSEGPMRISGIDWLDAEILDGRSVRGFTNGRQTRLEPVAAGARQNVFIVASLPNHNFGDYFDVPEHRLIIRYKDVSKGRFVLKTQSIHEGNRLNFVPLRGAMLATEGDRKWKTAEFALRPQDLGWYKGPEYQKYETDQLSHIANIGNDVFLQQYVERQRYFLDLHNTGASAIMDGNPFLSAMDDRNPLRIFRLAIPDRIKAVSDRLASDANSEHDKILNFLDFIAPFKVGVPSNAALDTTLTERVGACGEFTNLLLALAAAQGIPGRHVNFHNYPERNGHTVAELWIDGKWRLYDPSYSAYYLLNESKDALPASLEELRSAAEQGKPIKAVIRNNRPGSEIYADPRMFSLANPSGVIGPQHPMTFPLRLDIRNASSVDKSYFGPRHQGADYIGAGSINQNQMWTLSSLTPGTQYRFILTPEGMNVEAYPPDRTFQIQVSINDGDLESPASHTFKLARGTIEPWTIRFKAESETVRLNITHPYRGPTFHYLLMARYELKSSE